ncbi:MAG: DCC1-like thiol-disulfide oxidoreductase family protein [Planctomycetota bacterium]|nr:DCC1-like thiol-disulfide oxidoreductase family protein [Planctomycetota bacterium]
MSAESSSTPPILFYDGECGLCAKSVQWCLDHDVRAKLRFAPLQGPTYAKLALEAKPTDLATVVLYDEGRLHVRSDAVLRLLHHIGGGFGLLGSIGRVIPRFLRDAAYRFVATRRHSWFGAADRCRLPTPGESARFLA